MTEETDRDANLEARLRKLRPSLPTTSLDVRISEGLRRKRLFRRYSAVATILFGSLIGYELWCWQPEIMRPVSPITKPIDPPPVVQNAVRPGRTRTMRELFWGDNLSFDRPDAPNEAFQTPPPLRAGDWRHAEVVALLESEVTP